MGKNVRDDYILLNDLRFHFRDWGDATAPPLILLHGFTGHARSWDSLAAVLALRYRVLALDQRGHGETGWAEDNSTEAMVSDVAAFVKAMGLRSFDLLGLSMGGSNAYHYAGSRPEGLSRLVIVDIGPEVGTGGIERIMSGVQASDLFDSPEQALAAARAANPRADEAEQWHRVRNNLMRSAEGKWTYRYDRALRSPDRPRVRPGTDDNWGAWRKITVPTLLIRGGISDILSAEVAFRMVAEHPACRFVEIPGSGHSVPLEAPARFREAVETFL